MSTLLSLILILAAALVPEGSREALDRAAKLRDAGHHARAEEAYAAIAEADPEAGEAWFYLGYVRHAQADYSGAIAAGERAAEFPEFRATAFYNVACARSLSGDLEGAAASLDAALEAGFIDLELMDSDPDLAALRAARPMPMPAVHEFVLHRAPNGVSVPYFVQEPAGFDPERSYPALLVFTPGGGTRTADWAIEEYFGDPAAREGFLTVFVVPPERGWFTHPSHHALEAVLRDVKQRYEIEGRAFHMVGLLTGARAALTYSQMSGNYCASLTVITCSGWDGWDERDFRQWRGTPLHLIEGEHAPTLARTREVHGVLVGQGLAATLTVVPEGDARISGLRGADLRAALASAMGGPEDD